ncbi:DUF4142 domain-containing protein [Micromonospora lutea]|uniref:DUF4142 domain-containing protein n=1 Tax=Micromonospora lutea TaxID=419825 RepID=A0ABQ4ITR4_9ACTN|nr:DUF4142 domain-containing protein [Micromonospora lutea]GIJ21322.1 hypothetical protein Vlu01_19460 [Micromonospora lutea]
MLGIKRLGLLAALVLVGVAPAAAAQAAQPSEQDTQYLQAIHQTNLYEIAAGELAQEKGQNQQVKELGQQFVTDHTELDQSVQDLAGQLNVELSDEPTTDQQTALDQLNNASGEEFDRLWVTQGLAGHVQAIQATQTEISQGTEPQVVQLAQTALPVLQAHYDALVMLAEELGIPVPETSPSGTPSPGGTAPAPGVTTPTPGGTEPAPGGTVTEEAPVPGGTEVPVPQQS